MGYAVIGLVWLMMSYGPVAWRPVSMWVLWLLALSGALFSIYLTFLESFVIGASCAWCLSSAIVMSLLLWGNDHSGSADPAGTRPLMSSPRKQYQHGQVS